MDSDILPHLLQCIVTIHSDLCKCTYPVNHSVSLFPVVNLLIILSLSALNPLLVSCCENCHSDSRVLQELGLGSGQAEHKPHWWRLPYSNISNSTSLQAIKKLWIVLQFLHHSKLVITAKKKNGKRLTYIILIFMIFISYKLKSTSKQ